MKIKIISDSSCDLNNDYISSDKVSLEVVPLFINVGGKEYIDNTNLDVDDMIDSMNKFEGKTTSSCPSPQSYLDAICGADKYFITTISSKLSGSFNAATLAKNSSNCANDVEIIDSKSTSGAVRLIIDKIVEYIEEGKTFENITTEIRSYIDNSVNTNFVLDKFDNLVKNGRISPLKAKIASCLRVKPICEGENGEIKMAKKAIGIGNAIKTLVEHVAQKEVKAVKRVCVITYCKCRETAEKVREAIMKKCDFAKVIVTKMRGLNSFYAMENGLIVCYES